MHSARYALVGYVNGPVADFIQQIRQEVHPDLPLLAAHVTVLPPRVLLGDEAAAIAEVAEVCRRVEPFELTLGEVETFIPVTATVFIRVSHAYRMRELHDQLVNRKSLAMQEEWPYLPHLTIVKMGNESQAQEAYRQAQRRWSENNESRCLQIKELTFVREQPDATWVDVVNIPLGGVSSSTNR